MAENTKGLGAGLDTAKIPGHLLLARLGKRVPRPGGRELTGRLIDAVGLDRADRVVEFGPGVGATARVVLARRPASYTGVERDEAAARVTRAYLGGVAQRCIVASAQATGLPDGDATVVIGEAMLTMQREQRKREIVAEAWRVLAPGGRYAIHETLLRVLRATRATGPRHLNSAQRSFQPEPAEARTSTAPAESVVTVSNEQQP